MREVTEEPEGQIDSLVPETLELLLVGTFKGLRELFRRNKLPRISNGSACI